MSIAICSYDPACFDQAARHVSYFIYSFSQGLNVVAYQFDKFYELIYLHLRLSHRSDPPRHHFSYFKDKTSYSPFKLFNSGAVSSH